MSNVEDFRKKFLQRPQQIAQEKTAAELYRLQEKEAQLRQAAAQQLIQQREKIDLLQHQMDLVQQLYREAGVQQRIEAIASIISGGKIITESSLEESHVIYKIPYHFFTGRMIIHDPFMDQPGHYSLGTIASGSFSSEGEKGQKLSSPTTLQDRIEVVIKYEPQIKPNPLHLIVSHIHWQQERMTNTAAIFHRVGWIENRINRYVRFAENEWFGLSGRLADTAFTEIYDSYLVETGQA